MAAVYGAVGFGVLQVVELVVPALLLPEWAYRFIAVLIIAGFPIAIALAWSLERAPEGLRRTRPAQPGELAAIVRQPRMRRWPAGLLAVAGSALLTSAAWWTLTRPAADSGTAASTTTGAESGIVSSIAVLPFLDLSPDGTMAYFGDGMAEEILNVLAQVPQLKVSGRTSSFSFRERTPNIQEIGRALGVAHVLEGSVRLAGQSLRVTAQLVRTDDQSHAWSRNFDETFSAEDIFRIQDQIANEIAGQLRVSLGLAATAALERRQRRPTENTEAYQLYLEGRQLLHMRTETSVPQSIDRFSSALDLDPGFASAAAGLASAYHVVDGYTSVDYEPQALAEQYALAALEIDGRTAEAYAVLGSIYRDERRWSEAEAAFRQALEIEPHNPTTLLWLGIMELAVGRLDRGLAILEQAYDVDPGSGVISGWLAHAHRIRGDIDQAVQFIDQASEKGWGAAPFWACRTYAKRHPPVGLEDACREAFASSVSGENETPDRVLAETFIRSGDWATAMDSAAARPGRISVFWAVATGNVELEAASLEGFMTGADAAGGRSFINANVYLDVWSPEAAGLRADPRFRAWVEWMGMDAAWRETGWPASCQPVGESFICR